MTLTEVSPHLKGTEAEHKAEEATANSDPGTNTESPILKRNFSPTKPASGSDQRKKHVYLPARSLLVLTGPARYEWAHSIAMRKMDKVRN
jgi:hypothetical protein